MIIKTLFIKTWGMQRKFIAVKGNLKTKELIIIISKNVKEEQIKPKKVKWAINYCSQLVMVNERKERDEKSKDSQM